jgi:hypothetical protein
MIVVFLGILQMVRIPKINTIPPSKLVANLNVETCRPKKGQAICKPRIRVGVAIVDKRVVKLFKP